MGKGAIHYTGTNFRRVPRLDIVHRMRTLVSHGLVEQPLWLVCAERAPPLELHNLKLVDRKVHNKYLSLTQAVLKKYPNMRFQDCYVDGNDWSKGNDTYRSDHPVMQFVALQLRLMNLGLDRQTAFREAEKAFYARRLQLEKQQKLNMAAAVVAAAARDPAAVARGVQGRVGHGVPNSSAARLTAMGLGDVQPLFTTGQAYWQYEIAKSQANHLLRIRSVLRRMRSQAEAAARRSAEGEEPASDASSSSRSSSSHSSSSFLPWRQASAGLPSLRRRAFSLPDRRRRMSLVAQQLQGAPVASSAASAVSVAAADLAAGAAPVAQASEATAAEQALSAENEDLEGWSEEGAEEAMMQWFNVGEEEFDDEDA
ncbi:hypothetical protein BESB_059090 [Besnoitia besnoiti]|uniref:Small ribosomal subunit protein mS23 n=1 Tax=Besnoitia besnoiti TaxID=94643 RepID=A0A2A9MHZ8_BESBE|nr:hypothetical protein BESB_059090 [Besnoitia besnoiti]PFH35022.1 hypothetical protein BESB_059090 [Besnoitia besnoiti]